MGRAGGGDDIRVTKLPLYMERSETGSEEGHSARAEEGGASAPVEAVGDALRTAVERTLAATADSATGTRQRAQSLLDDVVRRGQVARESVTRRGEEATSRVAEAIGELRSADDEELGDLRERLAGIERRLAALEVISHPEVEAESLPSSSLEQGNSG